MKKWLPVLLGIIISVVALYFSFRQADFSEIFQSIRNADIRFVIAFVLFTVVLIFVRGWRWSILTRGKLSVMDGFWLFNVGFLMNNVLPFRLGEIARAGLAGGRRDMHFTSAFSSIVVERLFDMVSVVVLLGIVLIGLDLPDWARATGVAMGAGALTGMVILAYAAQRPQGAMTLGARILSLTPLFTAETAESFLRPFIGGLGGVSDWRIFLAGLSISLLAWFLSGVSGWILMIAFWPSPPLIMGLASVAAAGAGLTVPSAPSGIGPFHAAVIGIFTAVGYEGDLSRSFAFVMHGLSFLLTSVLGLVGMIREGLNFKDLIAMAQNSGKPAPSPAPEDST